MITRMCCQGATGEQIDRAVERQTSEASKPPFSWPVIRITEGAIDINAVFDEDTLNG
jgi:hypothetical protein